MSDDLHARAKSLFLRAVEVPEPERTPFIERECEGDQDLLAEVTSLLAHHRAETLIASPSATAPLEPLKENTPSTTASLKGLASAPAAVPRPHGRMVLAALAAIAVLATLGTWVHRNTEVTLRRILAGKLQGMLDADVTAVEFWIESKKAKVHEWSSDRQLSDAVAELLQIDATRFDGPRKLRDAAPQTTIRTVLAELSGEEPSYNVWDRGQSVIADSSPDQTLLGRVATPLGAKLLSYVFAGETILCIERPAEPLVRDRSASVDTPQLSILSPLKSDDRTVAALMIRDIDRDGELNRILGHVFTGETGECYGFDRDGVMLTDSRFGDELQRIGLIPPEAKGRSATIVSLRDPGGDLTAGFKSKRPLAACPLTSMAAHAVAGEDGLDLDGYRDYRGVPVIGAWKWLARYQFGVAIEIDRWEAYAPLKYLDLAFGGILTLLAIALVVAVASSFWLARLRREVKAVRQLGQYTLEQLIGEGGMGQVYRARHAFLKRATAVKILKPDFATPVTQTRFEREVQLSSQLTHPNTIEIYDFGCTPEGVLYYAMEYIDGLNLAEVVAMAGPLPAARVIHILRQIGGSLREAHGLGLLHRDIKPQNVMLCCRGGEADVVKVLDFGLVKLVADETSSGGTTSTVVVGTPLYMSPERLFKSGTLDGRCDLYAVGAVGFKLLTGKDIFSSDDLNSLLAQIVETPAPRPSAQTANAVPRGLDDLIVACLAKRVNDRPASAASLLEALDALAASNPWKQQQAFDWWRCPTVFSTLQRP